MQDNKFMALVALANDRFPSHQSIISDLNARLPEGEAVAIGNPQGAADDGSLMIEIGAAVYVCLFLSNAVPTGTFDHAAAASHFWKEAAADLAAHKAHVVVSEFSSGSGFEARRTCALHVSLIAAAVCTQADAIGLHWTTGETVTRKEPFLDEIGQLSRGTWPVYVWLQYYWVGGKAEENPGLATYGLRAFIGRELEFEPGGLDQQTLFARAGQIASYLVDNGDVLGDGETLGISESERIRVRHLAEGRRAGIPVLNLTLERSGALH
ncbi:MAG: DUF4261 domain-containing protein [Pseudomonadota bacterium]